MIDMGWTAAEKAEYFALCIGHHQVFVDVRVMDLSHRFLGSLSGAMLTGSVTMDSTSEVQRSASLTFVDVNEKINLAPDSPRVGADYPSRMLQIIYCVGRLDGSKWFNVPVFTGPVTKVGRQGYTLQVECMGKEVLSNGTTWIGHTYGAGWNRCDMAIAAMRDYGNESTTYMDVERKSFKTSKVSALDRNISTWGFARAHLNAAGLQGFYDGRGVMRGRTRPSQPVFVYDSRSITEDPEIDYSLENAVNAVEITGATPSGKKSPIYYYCYANASHPLAPYNIGRFGKPMYLPRIEQSDDITTLAQAQSLAQRYLADGLLESNDVTFPGIFIPGLEEADVIRVQSNGFNDETRVQKATLSLVVNERDSIGYTKKVPVSRLTKALRRP